MLRTTPGVAEVNTSGGYEKQIVIQPDPARLMSAGLSFADLAERIGERAGSVVRVEREREASANPPSGAFLILLGTASNHSGVARLMERRQTPESVAPSWKH